MEGFCVRGEVATGGREPTRSGLKCVGFKVLIVDPDCEFLGVAGRRKTEHRFKESEEEEGQVAARKKGMSTCRLVHSRKDYDLRLRSYLASA
jgi:hypothetical protein